MTRFSKLLFSTVAVLAATPSSAAPLLYSFYENGSATARFTFILDDKPRASPLLSDQPRDGFGTGADLTLFFTTQPMGWYIQFFTAQSGGGFSALGATAGDTLVGQQLFTGSTANPTMLTGRFNLVDQYFGTAAVLTVAAIPEPATWTMLLVGFGMIGATTRYRRRSSEVTYV